MKTAVKVILLVLIILVSMFISGCTVFMLSSDACHEMIQEHEYMREMENLIKGESL